MSLRSVPALLLFAALAGCRPGAPAGAPAPAAETGSPGTSGAPSAERMRGDLTAFAHDSMRGRESGTPDAVRAARFLAERLRAMGVEPAGSDGFLQPVPLTRIDYGTGTRIQVTRQGAAPATLRLGNDVTPLTALGPGAHPRLQVDAEIAFASYGISDAALGRDDYRGMNLVDKAVVVVASAPPGVDSVAGAKYEGQGGLGSRLQRLAMSGAAAIVLVIPDRTPLYEQAAGALLRQVTARDTTPEPPASARRFPMILLVAEGAAKALMPQGWPGDGASRAMPGTRLQATLDLRKEQVVDYNVVGVVRGSDAARRNSYVAYGAHLDHVGMAFGTDSVNNGADDDGSGSVALLELARVLTTGPKPKRSTLLVFHAAEEKGLLGSAWFAARPTVPIDSIVAQVNADMVGRNGADSLYVVGPVAAPNGASRVLGAIADSVNARSARPFTFDRSFDSPTHPEQIYTRSDHYNYAMKGIPVLFLTSGLHKDYHQASDETGKIDFGKMARVVGLMRDMAFAIGDRPTRPR